MSNNSDMISVRHLYSLEDLTEINVSPIKVTGELCDEEGISFLLRTYTSRILKGAHPEIIYRIRSYRPSRFR